MVTWLSSLPNWAGELRLCQHGQYWVFLGPRMAKTQALTQLLTFPCFCKIFPWHYSLYMMLFSPRTLFTWSWKVSPQKKTGLMKKNKSKVGGPMWFCNQELRKLIIILLKIWAQMNVPESGYGFAARPSWAVPSLNLCSLLGEESPLRHSLLKEPTSIEMRSVVEGSHSSSRLCLSSQHRTTYLPSVFICTCSSPNMIEMVLEATKSATSCTKRRHFYTVLGFFPKGLHTLLRLSDFLWNQGVLGEI